MSTIIIHLYAKYKYIFLNTYFLIFIIHLVVHVDNFISGDALFYQTVKYIIYKGKMIHKNLHSQNKQGAE